MAFVAFNDAPVAEGGFVPFDMDAPPAVKSSPVADIGHNLKVGADVAAQDVRELVGRVPFIGKAIVASLDKVDELTHKGVSSERLLKEDVESQTGMLSTAQQEAGKKRWDTLGDDSAWRDWRSYTGGLAVSAPEQAAIMFPAMRLAKGVYAASLAKTVAANAEAGVAGSVAAIAAQKAAGGAAARAAAVAGGVGEGTLGGAQASREVRDAITALTEGDLKDSEALGSLMAGPDGLDFDGAREQLAEDASTKAFFLAGVATGVFGGMGDRVLAKAMTGQLKGGIVSRFAKGAVSEGVLEELPQSSLQQVSQNFAMRDAVPSTELSKDVANQALGGLAIGGLQGGGQVAVFGRSTAPSPKQKILNAGDVDSAVSNFKFELGDKTDAEAVLAPYRKTFVDQTVEEIASNQATLEQAFQNDPTFSADDSGAPTIYGVPLRAVAPQELPPHSDEATGLSRDALEAVSALNAAQGLKTIVYADSDTLPDGAVNAAAAPGVVFLSDRTSVDPAVVASHEIEHLSQAGEKQAEFIRVVNEELTADATDLAHARHDTKDSAGNVVPMSDAKLIEEIRADIRGDAVADPAFWGRVTDNMRLQLGDKAAESHAVSFLESISNLIARVRAVLTGKTFVTSDGQRLAEAYLKNLSRVHEALAAAVADRFIREGRRPPGGQTNVAQVLVQRALDRQAMIAENDKLPPHLRTKIKNAPVVAPEGSSAALISALAAASKAPFDRSAEERLNLEAVKAGVRMSPKQSEVSRMAAIRVRTPEFKKWFAGSKVADVVYHGTGEDFETPKGRFWATSAPTTAETYAEFALGGAPAIVPAHMAIKKPLVVDADGLDRNNITFRGRKYDTDDLADIAEKEGYDGVIVNNVFDSFDGSGGLATSYVAFRPEQVKSVFNNRPTASPSMSMSPKQSEKQKIEASRATPKIVEPEEIDDNVGVRDGSYNAFFEGDAQLRFTLAKEGPRLLNIEASPATRGQDMVAWLHRTHGKAIVEDVVPGAEGFWEAMLARGLIKSWAPAVNDEAKLSPKQSEKQKIEAGRKPRAATPKDFTREGVEDILDRSDWTILTAENPGGKALNDIQNAARMRLLRDHLKGQGLSSQPVKGKYGGNEEHSLIVFGASREQAVAIGRKFDQESVLTRDGLVYADGMVNPARGVNTFDTAPEDFYSTLPDGGTFSVDIDFDKRVPLAQLVPPPAKVTFAGAKKDPRTGVALTKAMRAASLDEWLYGDRTPFQVRTQAELGELMREMANSYVNARTEDTPENREFAARVLEHEIRLALTQEGHGLDWYGKTIDAAFRVAALIYPEIATNPDARFAFSYALAVTSNGATIGENTRNAFTVYDKYDVETGKMPVMGFGIRAREMKTAFSRWNTMVEKHGVRGFYEFVTSKHAVKDLEEVAPNRHEPMGDTLYGGTIIGSKIGGGFLMNLNGFYDALAMDRWYARTWGRILGNPLEGTPDLPGIWSAIDNAGEKHYARAVMETVLERVQKDRPDATIAGLQGTLWYPEKEFYSMHGVNSEAPTDYEQEVARYAESKGIDPTEISEARRARPAGRVSTDSGTRGQVVGPDRADASAQPTGASRTGVDGGTDGSQPARLSPKAQGSHDLVGVHFSTEARTSLSGAYYGRGMKGEEAKRIAASSDGRLKWRTYMYVNTGSGVRAEKHVGGQAHVVTMTNLYDADSDLLNLYDKDLSWFESKVLNAGFDGYFTRGDKQGVAVIIGQNSVQLKAESKGTAYRGDDLGVPPAQVVSEIQQKVQSIAQDKSLPDGQMTGADWRKVLGERAPAALDDAAMYYKSDIGKIVREGVRLSPKQAALEKWAGNTKVRNPDGSLQVWYHGTARDISEFKPKQAGAIFLTRDTEFADGFSITSEEWKEARAVEEDGVGRNIMPLYVKAENPFDYDDPAQVDALVRRAGLDNIPLDRSDIKDLRAGAWNVVENADVQKLIKRLDHDGFYVAEAGRKNLAVYDSRQLKSVTGNTGEYDGSNPDIRKSPKEKARALGYDTSRTWYRYDTVDYAEIAGNPDGLHLGAIHFAAGPKNAEKRFEDIRKNTSPDAGGFTGQYWLKAKKPLALRDMGTWNPGSVTRQILSQYMNDPLTRSEAFKRAEDLADVWEDYFVPEVAAQEEGVDENPATEERIAANNAIIAALKEFDYDSIKYRNTFEGGTSIMVFEPSQVRSVNAKFEDATSGNVMFSPKRIDPSGKAYNYVVAVAGAGPFDGGCVLMANALHKNIGGRVVALVDRTDTAQHAMVEKDGSFFDYGGPVEGEPAALARFNENESASTTGVRALKKADLPEAPRGTAAQVSRLAGMLDGAKFSPKRVDKISKDFEAKVATFFRTTSDQPVELAPNTPASLQVFGWIDLPIVVEAKVLDKMKFDHGVTDAQFGKLPYLLQRPMFAFADNKNDSLVFVGSDLKDGAPALVAMKPERETGQAEDKYPSNMVVTGYSAPKGWDEVAKRLSRGELIYRDPSKAVPPTVKSMVERAQKNKTPVPSGLPGSPVSSARGPTLEVLRGGPPQSGGYVQADQAGQTVTPAVVQSSTSPVDRKTRILYPSDLVKWEAENWGEEVKFSPKNPFLDSKVQQVVYHGTHADFDEFAPREYGHLGFHFGTKDQANKILNARWKNKTADQVTGPKRILPVYLDLKNPLRAHDVGDWQNSYSAWYALNRAADFGDLRDQMLDADVPLVERQQLLKDRLASLGFDGLVYENAKEGDGDSYVVMRPEQIRSVFNDKDTGAKFSPKTTGASARTYTPAQERFHAKVGRSVQVPTFGERIAAVRKDLGKKIIQGVVDQFAPLKELSAQAYLMARHSKDAPGALEALLRHGKLKIRDGVYDADQTGGFIDSVAAPLQGEMDDALWWIAAHRAELLTKEDREHLFDKQDITDGKTLAEGQLDFDYTLENGQTTRNRKLAYQDTAVKYDRFNKNAMDMAEQSGQVDPAGRKSWERMMYVPFYRVGEEAGTFVGGNVSAKLVGQSPFKRLKGGADKLNSDLMENVIQNWFHLLDSSSHNRAAKVALEAAVQMGIAIEGPRPTVTSMAASIGNKGNTVWFLDGGVQRHFVVDDPYVMTAITSLEYAGMKGPIMKALSTFKHVLTVSVTASPVFKVRNLIRDSLQAVAVSDLSYNVPGNILAGIRASDKSTQTYVSALAGGALIRFGTMLEGNAGARARQLAKRGIKDSRILDSESKLQAVYDKYIEPAVIAYNELGNRSEEITRSALYKRMIDKGMDHATAAHMARDLMDFSLAGSWTAVRFLTQTVPFMNARMQGIYKLGRGAKENPARFAAVLAATALFSVALLAAYSDDDDWKKREDWDRDNYWWFKIGGVAFRIPKPFEIGAIATLAERGVELATDPEMTGGRFNSRVLKILSDQLSMNPIPQAVKPWLDVYANKDSFTGRPIESMGMERLQPDYRFTSRTSMAARAASTAGQAVTSQVGVDFLSPVQIDSVLRGYFSWIGSFAVGMSEVIARPLSGQPDAPAGNSPTERLFKLATGNFVTSLPVDQSRYVSHMYEQARVIEQAMGTYRGLLKQGKRDEAREFLDENRDQLVKYKSVGAVKRAISKLNERLRLVERSSKTPDEKREMITALNQQKDRIARKIK